MSAHHLGEKRIALCRPHGGEMTDRPDQDAGKPKLETETDGPG